MPAATNPHDVDNGYPTIGTCSGSGADCRTDADCPSGESCETADFQTAFPAGLTVFEWVEQLNATAFAGYSDWRIPSVQELLSILDYTASVPATDPALHGGSCGATCSDLGEPACSCTSAGPFWTETQEAFNPSVYWEVDFLDGSVRFAGGSAAQSIRAVRGP